MIRASPSHITLAIWVRVRVTGDAHITRVWEWECPKRKDAHITVIADNAAHRVNLSTGKRNRYPFIQWIALSSFEQLGPDS